MIPTTGIRKTGRAYRRKMKIRHEKALVHLVLSGGNKLCTIHMVNDLTSDDMFPLGKRIKRPKNSHKQKFYKRHSNKVVRRRNEIYRGNQYRKCFDYWWTLY